MFTTGKIYSHVCPHARVSLGRPIVSGCWSPCLEVDAFMERRRNSCCCPERRSGICHLCLSPGGCCFPQSNQSLVIVGFCLTIMAMGTARRITLATTMYEVQAAHLSRCCGQALAVSLPCWREHRSRVSVGCDRATILDVLNGASLSGKLGRWVGTRFAVEEGRIVVHLDEKDGAHQIERGRVYS